MNGTDSIVKAIIGKIAQIKEPILGFGLLGGLALCVVGRSQVNHYLNWFESVAGVVLIFCCLGIFAWRRSGVPSSAQEVAVEKTIPSQIVSDRKKRKATGTPNRRRKKADSPAPLPAPVQSA
jgi:hypothetical protein